MGSKFQPLNKTSWSSSEVGFWLEAPFCDHQWHVVRNWIGMPPPLAYPVINLKKPLQWAMSLAFSKRQTRSTLWERHIFFFCVHSDLSENRVLQIWGWIILILMDSMEMLGVWLILRDDIYFKPSSPFAASFTPVSGGRAWAHQHAAVHHGRCLQTPGNQTRSTSLTSKPWVSCFIADGPMGWKGLATRLGFENMVHPKSTGWSSFSLFK